MANIHGLFSNRDNDKDNEDDPDNLRYVGGVNSRGGGSGLAVAPNPHDQPPPSSADAQPPRDSIFRLAEEHTQMRDGDDEEDDDDGGRFDPPGRRITMYRNGFIVDDGPYRHLDDPANAEFLRSLAMGRTPRELSENNENVVVALIDKRQEDYIPPFQSFSGEGKSLGSSTGGSCSAAMYEDGRIDPAVLLSSEPPQQPDSSSSATTTIPVRTATGQRVLVTVNLSSTILDLARQLIQQLGTNSSHSPFVLQSGFPPRTITDLNQTVDQAGLHGSQVVQKLV